MSDDPADAPAAPQEQPRKGTAHPIVTYGTPVLHRRCAEVTSFDEELRTLVEDMFASMAAAEGVGLAANQIGVDARVFVVDCPDETGEHVVAHIVNPVLKLPRGLRRTLDRDDEGCLSVPGEYAELARPARAEVTGTDVDGRPVRIVGTGLLARCLQHEVDHLDGLVYVDRLDARTRADVLTAAGLGEHLGAGRDAGSRS
ncbi:peptide deformylase [Kineococcus xinjiangensis]|uniref:Peptide deformylase n=1 Tax=Kineococcus xinjiangensis TaxID=512762 RepID=A0A2S6IFW7_9ACTN|nr:peptide deformylase [Kineococcus xinjiangensis]PPK93087.1 peptide deformylase [Kineococcus xinjiangensis]